MTQRQIDDVDTERVLVGDRELDGADDRAGVALPGVVEHLEDDQGHTGRDTAGVVHLVPRGADESRDMGAVPIPVRCGGDRYSCRIVGEIVCRGHTPRERTGSLVEPRVDHGHGDTGAGEVRRLQAERARELVRGDAAVVLGLAPLPAPPGIVFVGGSADHRVDREGEHSRVVGENLEIVRVEVHGQTVDQAVVVLDVIVVQGQRPAHPSSVASFGTDDDPLPAPAVVVHRFPQRLVELLVLGGSCCLVFAFWTGRHRGARHQEQRDQSAYVNCLAQVCQHDDSQCKFTSSLIDSAKCLYVGMLRHITFS